jgi:hypothetical protein
MYWLILLAILGLIYYFINRTVENHKHWSHSFDGIQFSSNDFYNAVVEGITRRQIPDVEFSRVNYTESGFFSDDREYLHIVRGEYIIDICAAPFGTCFFVSSWLVQKPSFLTKLLRKVKALAPFVERKTYYQIDTEGMFQGAVHASVLEAIDYMTTTKGVRALSESQRMFAPTV